MILEYGINNICSRAGSEWERLFYLLWVLFTLDWVPTVGGEEIEDSINKDREDEHTC